MSTVKYNVFSPYYSTPIQNNILGYWKPRSFRKLPTDTFYQIDSVYQFRPDILANDLYGHPELWWVFCERNPDVIKDPIFDFKAGVEIFIPLKTTLQQDLGF